MFDLLYDEIVTITSDFMVYMVGHIFIELVLALSTFVVVMLIPFVDLSWIPNSSIERESVHSIDKFKKHVFE